MYIWILVIIAVIADFSGAIFLTDIVFRPWIERYLLKEQVWFTLEFTEMPAKGQHEVLEDRPALESQRSEANQSWILVERADLGWRGYSVRLPHYDQVRGVNRGVVDTFLSAPTDNRNCSIISLFFQNTNG